jgi:HlyD family secretion protein
MAAPKRSIASRLRIALLAMLPIAGLGGIVYKKLAPIPVVATRVVRGTAVEAVYATGTVEAESRVMVRAKISGSMASVLVKEGAVVKKGDLLARIDNPVVSFDLQRGQAEAAAAAAQGGQDAPQVTALREQARSLDADLVLAKQDRDRFEKLVKSGAMTEAELERVRTRITQLEASIAANQAQQKALRINLSADQARSSAQVSALQSRVTDTEVRAPSDGVVLSKLVEIGEVVTVNQPLFKVGDISSLVLEVSVDEADIARVHDGKRGKDASRAAVSLYAFPKTVFAAKVFEVLPDANRERKAFLVKVRLDEPPAELRSGMSAEANIIVREKPDVVLAPSAAESGGAVWVVDGGRARKKKVSLGIRDLLRVEVLDGLQLNDTVIIGGTDNLKDGARVQASVREPDPLEPVPVAGTPRPTSL